MQHQLIIPHGVSPDHPMDDQIRVMARTNVEDFEDFGYPEIVTGNLIEVPNELLRMVRSGEQVFADMGGKSYRFTRLDSGGSFELRRSQDS